MNKICFFSSKKPTNNALFFGQAIGWSFLIKAVFVPQFVREPESSVMFFSENGYLIPCSVDGNADQFPGLRITWEALSGANFVNAANIPGLRSQLIRGDGSFLAFHPFLHNEFNASIHRTVYRCLVQYKYGVLGSRRVSVKASEYLKTT